MLELTDVCFAYAGRAALLDGVSVCIEVGSFVAVTGPSGSGKSTLLALMGGLLVPTSGSIRWIAERPARRPPITWVPQTAAALPARSVLDNVMLGSIHQWERAPERRSHARAALVRVGLRHLIDTRARHLSGGETQRMVVARALATHASVILADEPTSQNDARNSRRIMAALSSYTTRADGRLVVVATHDVDSLPSTARVLELAP